MWLFPVVFLTTLTAPSDTKAERFSARERDWRQGAVVYQIYPDRFAPPADREAKKRLFLSPRVLRDWTDTPKATPYDPKIGYAHVYEFWGGDLKSIQSRLDYVQSLGADVVYLNPIFKAFSNHKYDTEDYTQISPEYGTRQDFLDLVSDIHKREMRILLDGVFNHMGKTAPIFEQARRDDKSAYRNWFMFDAKYPDGYRGWFGIKDLPTLQLENPVVQDYLWRSPNSIVRRYLRDGIDGWRLDVAFDIGPSLLTDITRAAHLAKPGCAVIGEISGYPANWQPSVDGVFNFHSMNVCIEMLNGSIQGGRAGQMLERVVTDAGIENVLRSWLLVDNHDTPRLADVVPDATKRHLVHALHLTLPGSPVLYYGSELGMKGSGDPECRAPMRWDLANEQNEELRWVRQLMQIRKQHPALRYGDFRALDTSKLLAFTRTTHKLRDTVLVVVNPTGETIKETFATRVGRILSWGELEDTFTKTRVRSITGLFTVEVKPYSVMAFVPVTEADNGYTPYERIP